MRNLNNTELCYVTGAGYGTPGDISPITCLAVGAYAGTFIGAGIGVYAGTGVIGKIIYGLVLSFGGFFAGGWAGLSYAHWQNSMAMD